MAEIVVAAAAWPDPARAAFSAALVAETTTDDAAGPCHE